METQATSQQWRNTAREACEQLLAHYSQVSVVGLSLGGALALELSQTFPLEHLFLLAPALKLHYSAFLAYWLYQSTQYHPPLVGQFGTHIAFRSK